MRKSLIIALAALAMAAAADAASASDVHVRGYSRSDGTYVQPYTRTAPNDTKLDNYGCINGGRC